MKALWIVTGIIPLVLAGAAPASAAAGAEATWQPCADGSAARCTTLTVPADWDRPERPGGVELRVAVRPAADPANRVGALFFNPGGPGASAADIAATTEWAQFYFPPQLLERFDLVGVDPRGVPGSTPVECALPAHAGAVSRFPSGAAGVRELATANAALAASCEPSGMPLDTRTVARDLDHVRAVLGESKINFLGISYGTMLAQAYAERYPDRLRAVVLDGVVDRSLSAGRLALDSVAATQDRAGHLDADDLRELFDRADDGRITARGERVTAEELGLAIAGALALPSLDDATTTGIRDALATGDASALTAGAAFTSPIYARYRAIICQDVPRLDPAKLPGLARQAQRTGPLLRGAAEFWDIATGCVGWTPRPRWQPHGWRLTSPVPVLLLSGAHDPVTPRPWAEAVHRQIPSSTLLRWDGDGHAAWPVNSACAVRAATAYLIDPAPPATAC